MLDPIGQDQKWRVVDWTPGTFKPLGGRQVVCFTWTEFYGYHGYKNASKIEYLLHLKQLLQ